MQTRQLLVPSLLTTVISLCAAIGPTATQAAGTSAASDESSLQNVFVNIADRTMPSVVNIFTTQRIQLRRRGGLPPDAYDIWRDLFDDPHLSPRDLAPPGAESAVRPMALGTGFVIEADPQGGGLIVTNHHVVAGADEVKVKFTENDDERESPARVIGSDPELDIALLRVKTARKLTSVSLGDSDKLKVGEWIAAIGNPFGHGHSVSHGIVSAKARSLPGGFGRYLQVDAPINPGNSGGPLVNLRSEVVGINNAIDARGPGLGFAIPINAVKRAFAQLKSQGRVERGYIGIGIEPRARDGAPLVTEVRPHEPAHLAGLKPRDVILAIDGEPVKSPSDLVEKITTRPIGETVRTEVMRAGQKLHFDIKVGRRPDLRQARS